MRIYEKIIYDRNVKGIAENRLVRSIVNETRFNNRRKFLYRNQC